RTDIASSPLIAKTENHNGEILQRLPLGRRDSWRRFALIMSAEDLSQTPEIEASEPSHPLLPRGEKVAAAG
ncbi:hypothetical protein, partial [Rhizobium sp. Rhizsp42]|uniref:hypothetical protein n=1 Tax=Rhizobium sp. Rhizsp42 TaxID=3243034 RepID=UPI0039B0A280